MHGKILLDAHVHLQDKRFQGQGIQIVDRARQHGVRWFFCNGTRESDWQAVLELAEASDAVVPFLGIHPWQVETVSAQWRDRLELLVQETGCGIGETGLDKRCRVDFHRQERIFLAQLELACMYDRPLVIHCVRAWGRLIELLGPQRSAQNRPSMMIHSFAGSMETMEHLAGMGVFISYSGLLLDPGREKLRQVFARTPLELLLLETDAPDQYYDPNGVKSADTLNEPLYIAALYDKAAQIRKMDSAQLSSIIWQNGSVFTHRKTVGQ